MEKISLLRYYGGKTRHLEWIIGNLPDNIIHFVDAMSGSGSVALNVSATLVTMNDINNDVVNFFKQLRYNPEELIRAIYFTPFSREDCNSLIAETDSEIEKARKFFTRNLQSFSGSSQKTWHSWGNQINIKPNDVCRVNTWNRKITHLHRAVDKLRGIQIENLDVFELLEKYNSPNVFVYLDPPYLAETRNAKNIYKHEFTEGQHRRLLAIANCSKCRIMISGYHCELYEELLTPKKWTLITKTDRNTNYKSKKTECLWVNYPVSNKLF
ncbi:MAG: DNA adenine methylase [Bacteroidetes bacterium]|nr:MAG: DNA adenine methylase [Bacteroidota bacterium]